VIKKKQSTQKKELHAFQGLIGTPVNRGQTHWGLLLLEKTGEAYYYDSLSWNADKRIQEIARLVILSEFSLLSSSTAHISSSASQNWAYFQDVGPTLKQY